MGGFALTYDVVKKRLADKQRILQIDEEEFLRIKKERPNINGYKFPVIKTCCGKSCNTSVREVGHFTDDNDLCLDCIYKSRRLTYEELVDIFAKKGCTILTTKENFEFRRTTEVNCDSSAVKFKFSVNCCGNERESSYHTMKRINESWQCKTCVNKRSSEIHKATAKDSDGNVTTIQTEHKAFLYLKDLLSNLFYVEKLNDGNIADCIVKPIYVDSDIWLRVQIKSTLMINDYNCYRFGLNNNNYIGLLVICICVIDKIIWLIPGKDIIGLGGIGINDNSKYNKYRCNIDMIEEMMINAYIDDNYIFMDKSSSYIPKAITSQREHKFVLHRKKMLPFVNFIDNDVDNQTYDFKIGKHKVQEKSNNTLKHNGYWYSLCKANGRRPKNKKIPYCKGDNDFYWFNIPDMKLFYCIPECKMIEHGFLTSESHKGKTSIQFFPYPDKPSRNKVVLTTFANEYLFDYKNIDKEKFLQLFI